MIRAVLFDADDTLYILNKERAAEEMLSFLEKNTGIRKGKIESAWLAAKQKNSMSDDPEKRKRELSIKMTLEKLKIPKSEATKLTVGAVKIFENAIIEDIIPADYAQEALKYLANKYELAVASEEFEKFLKKKLCSSLEEQSQLFSFLITPEKTNSMKPSAKYAEMALKKFKMHPSEMAIVGNSWAKDLIPAKKLGITTILFSQRLEGQPTHWIKHFKELEKIL